MATVKASKVKPNDVIHLATTIAVRDAKVRRVMHGTSGIYIEFEDPVWGTLKIGFAHDSLLEAISLAERYPGQPVCRTCGKPVCPHSGKKVEEWG